MFAHTKLSPTFFTVRRFCLHALFWTLAFAGSGALIVVLFLAYLGVI